MLAKRKGIAYAGFMVRGTYAPLPEDRVQSRVPDSNVKAGTVAGRDLASGIRCFKGEVVRFPTERLWLRAGRRVPSVKVLKNPPSWRVPGED